MKYHSIQSMCFNLSTPEDPFNQKPTMMQTNRQQKNDNDAHSSIQDQLDRKAENGKLSLVTSISFMGPEIALNVGKPTLQIIKRDGSDHSWKEHGPLDHMGCPSKFLIMCLNSIQNALQQDIAFSTQWGRPFFANEWGLEFWNCYTSGIDVLEMNGDDPTVEQIAWITSTAADTISIKEAEGVSFNDPFLLYLAPSPDKAYKVLKICKPLKSVGIHAVSLHSGAAINHQIQDLKSSEPEFIVSTPGRLLELLSFKAVDISQVIDELEAPFEGTYFDAIKSIRQFISGNPRTIVFCDCINNNSSISVRAKAALGTSCK